ncbi:MAG: M20/M25/M40 family metallo-hydrolase, partial [Planctomycetes bacterium]|nr:M20/M25/M40 family metallo-hydrolase [Planctomycetota bacterium]
MSRACLSMISRFVLVVVLALVCSAFAQDEASKADDPNDTALRVDGDRIKSYVEWLARDEMDGRQSLTAGYKKAAEWAADNFKKWGLQPAGQDGTYFQDVPVERGFTYRTGTPELKVGNTSFLMEEEDYTVMDLSTEATRVDAEIVFVGYGISASDKGLDEYEGMDVKGKVVLALAGSPHDAPQPRVSFGPPVEGEGPSEAWKDESTDQAKIDIAYEKGAAGILLFADPKTEEKDRSTRQTRDVKKALEGDREFLAFTIQDRVLHSIMKPDRQESVRGFERRLASMRWDIRNKTIQSTATGVKARLRGYDNIQEYSEDLKNNIERNVIAKLPGTDPELKKEYIIMGGHMDHVGVRNGLVRNGADDNASGTAVTLEVARVLSEAGYKPKRTIIFCCWCAEELGLIGSRHYVANP